MATETCRGGPATVTSRTAVQELLDDYAFLAEVRLRPIDEAEIDSDNDTEKARLSVTGDITFEALDPDAYENGHHDDRITEFCRRLHPYLETPLEIVSYYVDERYPSQSTVYSWRIPAKDSDDPIRQVTISDHSNVYTTPTDPDD